MLNYTCEICGKQHQGLAAIGFNSPYHYDKLNDLDKRALALKSDDFCRIAYKDQTDYFIRTVMQLPIMDHAETLDYGIWVSVSEATFKAYFLQFDHDKPEVMTCFGMICNQIEGYAPDVLGLHVNVTTQLERKRPLIFPHQSQHALYTDFINGISYQEAEQRLNKAIKTV